jgi:hypothetical protein
VLGRAEKISGDYYMQYEITERDQLLDAEGRLRYRGYAKFPVLEYNPENVRLYPLRFLNRLRLKEWDYYGVTTPDFYFSATVANLGYAGMAFIYFIDFNEKVMTDQTVLTPFGRGCDLPRTSEKGDIRFQHKLADISFERLPEERVIKVDWPGFGDGAGLSAEFRAGQPSDMESIVVATPIGEKRFYYNQKINCMPAEGKIVFGGREYALSPDSALATLDWGRGVWEYRSFWNWASASGFLPGGSTVGLNIGEGFGDLSRATENCFFIDGKMTKLGRVDWDYDPSDFMKPWSFKADDGRLDLVFEPFFERVEATKAILIDSGVHQLFGRYSGTLTTDDGEKIEISNLIGWAEEHKARW